jgi:hypothetical protein
VEYFHVVFTVPDAIAAIAYQNKAVVYGLLCRATAETLRTIAADPQHLGAELGFLAVLHTWGQTLLHHPHIHCLGPGGGIAPDGTRWIACRPGFFLPVRVPSRLFRRLCLEHLRAAFDRGQLHFTAALAPLGDPAAFARAVASLAEVEWVVYAKPPFGGPAQVLDYLGRYTHRVALANHRLLDIDGGQVRFRWNDYRHPDHPKTLTLAAGEFIRRFRLHVLPAGFPRLRHYGFLGNRFRAEKLALCRQLLGRLAGLAPVLPPAPPPRDYRDLYERLTGRSLCTCPACQRGTMVWLARPPAERTAPGPPDAPPRSAVASSPRGTPPQPRERSAQRSPCRRPAPSLRCIGPVSAASSTAPAPGHRPPAPSTRPCQPFPPRRSTPPPAPPRSQSP